MTNSLFARPLFCFLFICQLLFCAQAYGNESQSVSDAERQKATQSALNQLRSKLPNARFRTSHSYPFVLAGNLSQQQMNHWRDRMRRTQSAIKKLYFKHDPSWTIQVWLFANARSYRHYTRQLWGIQAPNNFGFYYPAEAVLVMNIASGGGTLNHEMVHPYIEENFPQAPMWFNEGFASLFEQARHQSGAIVGLPNWRLKGLQQAIRNRRVPPLQQMLNTLDGEFRGPLIATYYAQSRYLMYYLQQKGLLQRYYQTFQREIDSDLTGERSLLAVTGKPSLQVLDQEWRRFILGIR